jgi:methionine sulfoxide reductase heme-binding subunit
MKKTTLLKLLVFPLCLVPLALLAWKGFHDGLGANPIEVITHSTGDWTIIFLLITLAITPMRRITGWHWLIRFRRMIGLYAFFYGALHFTTYIWLDKFFDLPEMLKDVGKRPFITVGFLGFLMMIPLAVTSTQWAIRKMGKNWASLHRLVYLSAIAGVVHYWWLVKIDIRKPLQYAVILALLLGWRVAVSAMKKSRSQRAPAAAPQGAD